MTRILFVEDDANLGVLLKENLDNKGFETVWLRNGKDGIDAFKQQQFNLCILDVMLPVKDGFTLSKEIRAVDNDVPIIFLTARSMHEDKIHGFENGADDYITKPFSTQELYLRIHAILRRTQNKTVPVIKSVQIGEYLFDYIKMTLTIDDVTKRLSSKEADLIHILVQNRNELVPRSVILNKIWGNDDYFSAKSMDVYISKIRRLLKEDEDIGILNAYGSGYKLIVNED
ncbi:MAG: two-component system response regulator [Bacteroidetes bacterium 46-16]|nr:MAG: two-component system response regulator [Bacteroidetes bacterium 46-16]